jgi:streptogramin lyase
VLISKLANPRQLSFGEDGALYVAEAGDGGRERCVTIARTQQRVCLGETGSILRISGGRATPVVSGLPSIASPGGAQASGPADVVQTGSKLAFVVQDTHVDAAGANAFGKLGLPLGRLALAAAGGGAVTLGADLARYEARHDPDHGAGAVGAGKTESDPYGLVAYRGGYAVVDAAANDLLWVDRAGRIHLLAVFPTQKATLSGKTVVAQSVPTSVAVGPDGALYVGELTGNPFAVGSARVWRVAPGQRPTVYAAGFTTISAITFDRSGRLLVLEITQGGLNETGSPGELLRYGAGHSTILVARGLVDPTGVAVGPDGSIYIADNGESASQSGTGGEILKLAPS